MGKKRTTTRRKSKKKSRKTPSFKTQVLRSIAGLAILLFLVCAAGILTHHFFKKEETIRSPGAAPSKKAVKLNVPRFEVFPKEEAPAVKTAPTRLPSTSKSLPKVAIIIDDLGYDEQMAEKLLELDAILTFSILPHSPFGKTIARTVHKKGVEMMLHLPMEPDEYPAVDPGPGTLLTSMSPDDLIRQLEKNLDSLPHIKGVNNHMGSKMTARSTQLYQIFSILRKRGLFYIDSRTTPNTLCKPSARLLQLPFAQRDIFLDHVHDEAFIRRQLDQLVLIAQQRGMAVGIAHPTPMTYIALRSILPTLKDKVRFVKASEIVGKIS